MTRAVSIKVLHIEDDTNDALLFKHACGEAGVSFEIRGVGDGDEAISYLCGTEKFSDRTEFPVPELILLDLKMPRLSGFDVLTWLRREGQFEKMPVIVFTSSNHELDVKRAYDLGANFYLVKPVGFEGLIDVARKIQGYWTKLNERPTA